MRRVETLQPDYFEGLYRTDPDPWRFASSSYERSKYAATLAALPQPSYRNAFEVGCSIGVLTAQLAPRCDALLSVDAAALPLDAAKRRCEALRNVHFEQMFVPQQWPEGCFDLVLLSEVVYYLCAADVIRLTAKVMKSTTAGSHIVLVHWTESTNYPLSGDEAADLFIVSIDSQARLERTDRHPSFRIDLMVRC